MTTEGVHLQPLVHVGGPDIRIKISKFLTDTVIRDQVLFNHLIQLAIG